MVSGLPWWLRLAALDNSIHEFLISVRYVIDYNLRDLLAMHINLAKSVCLNSGCILDLLSLHWRCEHRLIEQLKDILILEEVFDQFSLLIGCQSVRADVCRCTYISL